MIRIRAYLVAALALSIGTLPLAALAHGGDDSGSSGGTDSSRGAAPAEVGSAGPGPGMMTGEGEDGFSGTMMAAHDGGELETEHPQDEASGTATSDMEEMRGEDHATGTVRAMEEVAQHAAEQAREHARSFLFSSIASTTPAFSLDQLKRMIEDRRDALTEDASSTATSTRPIVEHARDVAVAVHALLAAKELLGGIGPEISQIAEQVASSTASTTDAQAQIQSRGFLTRLFFGGDRSAASALQDAVTRNEDNVQKLTDLLDQASTSAEVKATLQAQIDALSAEQTRLANLAKQQANLWGIFSWRF